MSKTPRSRAVARWLRDLIPMQEGPMPNSTERTRRMYPAKRRRRGQGSVYYDERRQHWVGLLDLGSGADGKRRRKKVTAENPIACQALLDSLREGAPAVRSWGCLVVSCGRRSVTDPPVLLCRVHVDELLDQVKPKRSKAMAVIYFARNGSLVKIGWTVNVKQRMEQLALPKGALMATIPGTRKDEAELHRRFASLRVGRSEWFMAAPELLEFAGSLHNPQRPDGTQENAS